jgi:hypothetical protein
MLLACLLLGLDAARLTFADRYDDAFVEARERNVPVLVLDFDGWSTAQGHKIESFYDDKEFLAATDGAVLVLASQEEHGEKKQTVDGAERTVCTRFGAVPCVTHRDMLPKVFKDFGKEGELRSPLFILAGPDHKELARIEGEQNPPELTAALKQAQKSLGAGLGRADYVRIKQGLKRIDQLREVHDFMAAVALCGELRKIPGSLAPQQQVLATEKSLEKAGLDQIQRAEQLWQAQRFLEALLEMDDARLSFGKLAPAASAATKMAAWEKAPEAKQHLAAIKDDRTARQLYQQGSELAAKGDSKKAIQAFEKLLKSYPDSRFCGRARVLLGELRERS